MRKRPKQIRAEQSSVERPRQGEHGGTAGYSMGGGAFVKKQDKQPAGNSFDETKGSTAKANIT